MKKGTLVIVGAIDGEILKDIGDGLYLVRMEDASQVICMENELQERKKVRSYTPKHKRANDVGSLN